MSYVVTGASGQVGRAVVAALAAQGLSVRAVLRSVGRDLPAGVTAVAGDLDEPDSLAGAFAGADGVFLLPGHQDMPGLVAVAAAAGVGRVVQLSGLSAGTHDRSNSITAMMERSEAAVMAGELAWTIVRPAAFMSNCLRWAPQLAKGDSVALPFPDVANAMTHPADIAAVVVAALTGEGHHGQIYRLSGPEPLRPVDQVRIVGEVLGRRLHHVAQSDECAWAEMTASMPRAVVEATFDFYVAGSLDDSVVYPTVEQITGAPPRPLRDWVAANRDAFPAPRLGPHRSRTVPVEHS